MSHELRTPLNAVLGYTDLILNDIYGDVSPKVRDVLGRVQNSGQHLLNLINDVLDLSKIEAGRLTLSLVDYAPAEIVHAAHMAAEPLAAAKNLALVLDIPDDLPPARGDERRLTQVLINLVGNAVKFTESGNVVISARAADGSLIVEITDTGPGIAPADQERIFEEFHQAGTAVTRKAGGTGLGLAIARRIVELHGGRIWVRSEPGQGATFAFSVPVQVNRQSDQA
jgi:signal transduction histidine kinase